MLQASKSLHAVLHFCRVSTIRYGWNERPHFLIFRDGAPADTFEFLVISTVGNALLSADPDSRAE
jgi:hypothetical protein